MVEAGAAKVQPNAVGETFVLAEDDAEDQRSPQAGGSAPDGALDPVAQPVTEAFDAAPASDLLPRARTQDDVDSLTSEPGFLVESAFGSGRAWLGHADRRLEDGPAWR